MTMQRTIEFTRRVDTSLGYDDAVATIKAALADEGFGVVTEIDIRANFKAALDVDIAPQLAHARRLTSTRGWRPSFRATSSCVSSTTRRSSRHSTRR